MTTAKKKKEVNFEEALKELETIVRGLESGETNLQSSIEAYERGVELKKICETKLKEAQAKIDRITVSPSGEVKFETFDVE